MQTGPAGFDAALAAGTSPTITVTADVWGATVDLAPMTSRIQITRELASDLPTLASAASGSVAASASLEVDGFAPGAPNPLTAVDRIDWTSAPVSVSAGFAGLTVPVFAGTVRDMGIDELTRKVTVSALDGADQLRAPLTLPQFGNSTRSYSPAVFFSRPTNLSAVVVAALHANGIRVTPAPRAGCLFSMPGVGGSLAEVGSTWPIDMANSPTYYPASPPSTWVPGPFGPALQVADGSDPCIPVLEAFSWVAGAGFATEGYWDLDASVPGAPADTLILFYANADATTSMSWGLSFVYGALSMTFYDSTTGVETLLSSPTVATYGWHHVAMQVSVAGYWALWLDGSVFASGTSTLWSGSAGRPYLAIEVGGGAPAQAVQVHGYAPGVAFDTPTAAYGFVPQADVDQSILDLGYVPIVEDRISWEVLKEVAAADLGVVGFDESGRFFFRSSATLNAASSPVATISTDIAANLVGGTALASVVSTVSTKVRPHGYVFGGPDRAGVWQTPCQLTSVAAFPAASTSSQIFTAPRPVIVPPGPVTVWTAATAVGSLPGYEHVVLLCSAPDGTSGQVSASTSPLPTALITQISSNTLVLTVTNPTSTTLYAVIPTSWDASPNVFALAGGSPGLLLSGWSTPIDADIPTVPIASTDSTSASLYGPRVWSPPESQWRQDKATTQALTDALLPDLSFPRLLLENVQTQWDPRWQLGDVVTVTDALGRMPDQLARITAIDPTLSLDVERFMTVKLGLRLIPPTPVTAADYDAWWSGSTAAHHDAQWAAARPGGVTAAQADALPLRVSP